MGSGERLKQDTCKKADHTHTNAITRQMICLIVSTRHFITLGQTHQARCFARRQKSASDVASFNDNDRLSA